jgi:hypothetical protein
VGTFFYGTMFDPVAMPDDILAHVKAIASVKLRRNECFMLSWRYAGAEEQGMTSVWLQPSIPLRFQFTSAEPVRLDPAVLHHEFEHVAGIRHELDTRVVGFVEAAGDILQLAPPQRQRAVFLQRDGYLAEVRSPVSPGVRIAWQR